MKPPPPLSKRAQMVGVDQLGAGLRSNHTLEYGRDSCQLPPYGLKSIELVVKSYFGRIKMKLSFLLSISSCSQSATIPLLLRTWSYGARRELVFLSLQVGCGGPEEPVSF